MTSPVDMHVADARLANAFVRRFALMLRAPDALHLAISQRVDATLVTLDSRLASAARARHSGDTAFGKALTMRAARDGQKFARRSGF